MKRAFGVIATLLLSSAALADDVQPAKMDKLGVCRVDVQKLCAGVEPGAGRIVTCLRQHQENVSSECKARIEAMAAKRHRDHETVDGPDKAAKK